MRSLYLSHKIFQVRSRIIMSRKCLVLRDGSTIQVLYNYRQFEELARDVFGPMFSVWSQISHRDRFPKLPMKILQVEISQDIYKR